MMKFTEFPQLLLCVSAFLKIIEVIIYPSTVAVLFDLLMCFGKSYITRGSRSTSSSSNNSSSEQEIIIITWTLNRWNNFFLLLLSVDPSQ